MNTWITSDTHAFHENIVRAVSSWDEDAHFREFKDEVHMTQAMADEFNKYVEPEDTLYHLGDWSFGGRDKIAKFRGMLNVKNIHLIYGNHDEHILKNKNGEQDLFTSVQHYKEKSFGSRPNRVRMIMCHYAMRLWNKSHHGSIQLHGHSHDGLQSRFAKHPINAFYNKGRTMDVGVDAAFRLFGQYRPFHVDEIMKIMDKREDLFIDHHNRDTN